MTETATENLCEECGGPAPILTLVGTEIRRRYCDPCAEVVTAREQLAEEGRSLDRALALAGMTPRLAEQTLASHPNRDAAAAAVRWLATRPGNFWISGPVGLGKSGLAWGMVRELTLEAVGDFWLTSEEFRPNEPRPIALFLRWADLLDDLKASFDVERRGDVPDPSALLTRAATVPVLALDDLGRERPTPYAVDKLANLVEARYQRKAATIVTSNYRTNELAVRLSAETSTTDGERIVSRLLEGATPYRFEGQSLRRAAQT